MLLLTFILHHLFATMSDQLNVWQKQSSRNREYYYTAFNGLCYS